MASQQSFLMVVQLLLRAASIALSVAAISVGLSVSARSSIPWIMVFVAASVALLTSSIEFRPHLLQSCRLPRSSHLPPWVFIITDITAIGLVVYAVWGLVNYQGSGGKWENEKVAEIWVLVALGIIHLFCVLFDCFECCVLRERQQEIRWREEEERDFWL